MEKKRKVEFNIIKDDPTMGHKGFGIGSLSLENITPIMIDVEEEEVWIEEQAMHARSKTERGVKYLKDKSEFPKREQRNTGSYGSPWTLKKKARIMRELLLVNCGSTVPPAAAINQCRSMSII